MTTIPQLNGGFEMILFLLSLILIEKVSLTHATPTRKFPKNNLQQKCNADRHVYPKQNYPATMNALKKARSPYANVP